LVVTPLIWRSRTSTCFDATLQAISLFLFRVLLVCACSGALGAKKLDLSAEPQGPSVTT